MKLQACMFRRYTSRRRGNVEVSAWEKGVAAVESYGYSSVTYIIDSNGDKLKKEPYDWRLLEGPLSYMNTEYTE